MSEGEVSVLRTELLAEKLFSIAWKGVGGGVGGSGAPAWEGAEREERIYWREAAEEVLAEVASKPDLTTTDRVRAVIRRGMDENRTAAEIAAAIREELEVPHGERTAREIAREEVSRRAVEEHPSDPGRCVPPWDPGRPPGQTEGVEAIRLERHHQITTGRGVLHDVECHGEGELAQAAAVMALAAWYARARPNEEAVERARKQVKTGYVWIIEMAREHADSREQMLRVAGALAAAEIDREAHERSCAKMHGQPRSPETGRSSR